MVKTSRHACPDKQLRSPRQDSVTYWAARRVTSRDVALCHVILPHKFKPKTPCRLSDGLTVTSPESYSVARVIARGRSELTAHRCLDTGTWVNTQLVVECRYLIAPIHWRVPTGLEFARSRGTRVPENGAVSIPCFLPCHKVTLANIFCIWTENQIFCLASKSKFCRRPVHTKKWKRIWSSQPPPRLPSWLPLYNLWSLSVHNHHSTARQRQSIMGLSDRGRLAITGVLQSRYQLDHYIMETYRWYLQK